MVALTTFIVKNRLRGQPQLFELRHSSASSIDCLLRFFEIRRRRCSVSSRAFGILASNV
jgi:hypothetical protein